MSKTSQDWPAIAEKLGGLISKDRLHPAVLEWAEKSSSRGPWSIAFSGGADSLALLLLLWIHFPEKRGKLHTLHFNHRLRGRQALSDARFCQKIAKALHIPHSQGDWESPPKSVTEAQARDARLDFFRHAQRQLRSNVLWLGHQQDDIAETMLMRIARGSGTAGLAAPRPIQIIKEGRKKSLRLRPLLSLDKVEILGALRQAGAHWCEDHTNAESDFFRNRIRNSVLPSLQKAAGDRDILSAAANTRALLEEDDDALEQILDRLSCLDPGEKKSPLLHLETLHGQPRALQRRALHRWLLALPEKHRPKLSRQGFSQLLAIVEAAKPTRFSLGQNTFARIRKKTLFLDIKK